MRTSFAVLAFSAVAAVSAQRKVYTAADINVNAVTVNQRANWCVAERNTCKVLCQPNPTTNDCNSRALYTLPPPLSPKSNGESDSSSRANWSRQNTLEYSCLCPNGSAPGLEYYEQTMPTFICEKAFEDCIAANVGDKNGQDNCTDTIKSQCGSINAQAGEASGTTTSASASATNAPTGTGSAAAGATTAPSSSSSSAWAAPTANPARYGNAAAVAAIGLFAYML
ncbi:PCI domain-containing protein [Colletotrichum tofieldiae]|nr:PCI domain-containing protein [Colletotrichum tofieldiae]GKT72547.1 PCI domain-containing protein [Colletotrichum tofieldiae]